MKPTRAVLDAIALAERDGRVVSSVSVNPLPLGQVSFESCTGESEAEFQKRFVAHAKARGWKVASIRRVRVQRKNGQVYYATPMGDDGEGFPDLELVRERLIKVELKVKKNKQSVEQMCWANAYNLAGIENWCFYPKDFEVIERVLS